MIKLPNKVVILSIIPFLYFSLNAVAVLCLSFYLLSQKDAIKTIENVIIKKPIYTLFSKSPPILGAFTSRIESSEAKPIIIEQFFAKYRSPLAAYGEKFIEVSDK